MYEWFDCYLPVCGGSTEYFLAVWAKTTLTSSTSRQSVKVRLQNQNCLILSYSRTYVFYAL